VRRGGFQEGHRLGAHIVCAPPNNPRQQPNGARPSHRQSLGQHWNDREQQAFVPRTTSHKPRRQYRNDREPQRGHSVTCKRTECMRRVQTDKEFNTYLLQNLEDQRRHMDRWFPDGRDSEDEMDWQPEEAIVIPQLVETSYWWDRTEEERAQDAIAGGFTDGGAIPSLTPPKSPDKMHSI